ncbi:MAG: C13 family peptidase [Betaproteobacteria bacterium]
MPDHYGPAHSRGALADLASNLGGGLRALFLLPPPGRRWRAFSDQVVLLALLDMALGLAGALWRGGPAGSFVVDALPRVLLPFALALLAGWVVSRVFRRPALALLVAVSCLSVSLWFDLLGEALQMAIDLEWAWVEEREQAAWSVLFGWWAAALGLSATRAVAGRWLRRLAVCGWTVLVAAAPLWWLPYQPLWQADADLPPEDRPDAWAAVREDVLNRQGDLIEQAAARLSPQRPGMADVFFVGAAGYAAEDVFLNEASLASQVVEERLDAQGRAVTLANNPRSVHVLPMASVTALARAVRAVAQRMDREEDFLLLFVTSHGSQNHRLSMEFWPLQLQPVSPQALKAMLDEAGVRWRIVVVSACFSGGFVAPLADARTVVITAAAADRQSFGCGNGSDLTWFGRAFFDEALRRTFSLSEAFGQARALIAARERARGYQASDPQMHVGAEIAPRLKALEQRLLRRAIPGTREASCAPGPCAGDGGRAN